MRRPDDLRGKHFDGATPGGEGWYLARHVLTEAALTPADLTFSERFTTADGNLALTRLLGVR